MTDPKLPDEQGKAREFEIRRAGPGWGHNVSVFGGHIETGEIVRAIEFSAYDQLEARRKELEATLKHDVDKIEAQYATQVADQAALIGEYDKVIDKIQGLAAFEGDDSKIVDDIFDLTCEVVKKIADIKARARHGDLRGDSDV